MQSTIRDVFDIGADAFWRDVFFDRTFVERMYKEALSCESVEFVTEKGDLATGFSRRLRFTQKIDAPGPVRKLFGETTTMEEEGRFESSTGRFRFVMTPDKMADKITIAGSTWLEPAGDGKVARISQLDFTVKIFGVGSLVEKFMAKQTAESLERQARFTRAYIAEKGLA
jgi:Protein of unknown function (DUF2505)